MTHRWQVTDYRAQRKLLDPEIFLNGSNPPPSDLIEKEVWDYLLHLADHVSITTSNHHGRLLRRLFDLERAWVHAIAEQQSYLDVAMVDVMDDFTSSMFMLLHGYYRQSISALRSVVETTMVGAYLELLQDKRAFEEWRNGQEFGFGRAADNLRNVASIRAFEERLRAKSGDDLLSQRSNASAGGWSRRLFGALCEYTHSHPGRTNADLWSSNGPIYVEANVRLVASLYIETFALTMLLVRLARPSWTPPTGSPTGLEGQRRTWARLGRSAYAVL